MAPKYHTQGNILIKYAVIVFDFVLLNCLLAVFFIFGTDIVPTFFRYETQYVFLATNTCMLISEYFFHNIIYYRAVTFEHMAAQVFKLTSFQVIAMFLILRLISDGGGFFKFMVIFGCTLFLLMLLTRCMEILTLRYLRKMGRNTRNVVLVGSDPALLQIYRDVMIDITTGYKVLGYYSDSKMSDAPDGLRWCGTMEQFFGDAEHIRETMPGIEELFCSLSHSNSDQIAKIMQVCDQNIVHFYYVPRMFGNFRLNLKPEMYGDKLIFTNHQEPLSNPVNQVLKRCFDILFSFIVCLCLLPFIPIIALIIKRQSPGPLLFKQKRTGLNGETFTCYKFRSMHINKDADIAQATKDDPRKFSFGNFMRKTNIDELPQFFNVLKGDMSVVGPRPHMLHHTDIYGSIIDKYMVRHFCKPGITGYAQVTGFRGETRELWEMEGRIEKDIWYIENWTFWLDIKIIFLTVWSSLVPDKNAY